MSITLPTSTGPGALQIASNTFADPGMATLLVIILGTLLAVVVIEILINAIRPSK